ncbi:CotH kinase family protein [Pedobacter psychroterrae]|uniref:CotH protein n=1 Tax=Pedobacter psychroterrae TaxID=2530453 RepID=A0A4R0NQD4_9SPHI|nr:CotH kinase family protein [Pedobacter psychroterrae]TCD03241.1 hypothetical protein EZ437_04520 [Pedobacter psychroterrae]
MKKHLIYLILLISIWSCKKDNITVQEPEPEPRTKDSVSLISVLFEAKYNAGKITKDISGIISGDEIKVLIPDFANNKKFVASFITHNARITVNDTIQISGTTATDFSKPVLYKLTSEKGTTKTYKFLLKNFTGIPILHLSTEGGNDIVSKDVYLNGSLIVNTNTLYEQAKTTIPLQVKGRGNSTWGMEKKPYRLKFTDKTPMLGMPTAKNWVLLANYSDKTLLRTSTAFEFGTKIGADFTPQGRPVELVLNGKYKGSYFLTSQVEVNENRVNIPELKKSNTSAEEITGGYLLEQDERRDEPNRFETEKRKLPFTIKSPEDITPAQFTYIKNYMQQTEDAIFSEDFADPEKGYNKYINTESFINWFIVQEIMKNQDAKVFSSIFYYKNRGGKLGLGPLWDFDLAAGNVDYSDARYSTGWWIKDGPWFSRLFQDPNFSAKVKARWNALKNKEIKDITASIDQNAAYINLSQRKNFEEWKILDKKVWPNPVAYGTYSAEVAQLKTWLSARITWLDVEINKF